MPDPPDNDEEEGEAPEADGGDEDEEQDADRDEGDIQASLRLSPHVIMADTWANRAQRTRIPTAKYQAGTETPTKKPGLGRGQ